MSTTSLPINDFATTHNPSNSIIQEKGTPTLNTEKGCTNPYPNFFLISGKLIAKKTDLPIN
jgi:hypothetical protein